MRLSLPRLVWTTLSWLLLTWDIFWVLKDSWWRSFQRWYKVPLYDEVKTHFISKCRWLLAKISKIPKNCINPLQMVPAVAQIKSGTPAKSLPLANLYSPPRQIQIKTPCCGERERSQNWRVLVVARPRRRGIYIGVADSLPPPLPSATPKTGESFVLSKWVVDFLETHTIHWSMTIVQSHYYCESDLIWTG